MEVFHSLLLRCLIMNCAQAAQRSQLGVTPHAQSLFRHDCLANMDTFFDKSLNNLERWRQDLSNSHQGLSSWQVLQNKWLDHISLCLVSFHIESMLCLNLFLGSNGCHPKVPPALASDVRPFWLMKKLRGKEWNGNWDDQTKVWVTFLGNC